MPEEVKNPIKKRYNGGRPTKLIKKLRVSFTLSPEMRDKVDMLARSNKSSISSIIETLLQQTPVDFKVVPKRSYNRKDRDKNLKQS
jgi:hypothetical protein